MKKARPKSINTNYSENANLVTKKTLGAERWTARKEDETFEGDENVLYIDCSYSFFGICMHHNLSDYAFNFFFLFFF